MGQPTKLDATRFQENINYVHHGVQLSVQKHCACWIEVSAVSVHIASGDSLIACTEQNYSIVTLFSYKVRQKFQNCVAKKMKEKFG